MTHELKDDVNYVISDDWKSTGSPLVLPIKNSENNPWYSAQAQKLLLAIFDVAQQINESKGHDQAYVQQKLIDEAIANNEELPHLIEEMELPALLFDGLDSSIVLLIRVDGRAQALSKYLAQHVLSAGITGAITGGLAVAPRGSYAFAQVVAFNTKTRKILWSNRSSADGNKSVNWSIKMSLESYPYSDGETKFQKKLKKQKRARGF